MNDTKYTPVLVSYSLRNSKQPGFCQNSQVPRPLRITRLSEPFVGFPNNVRGWGVFCGKCNCNNHEIGSVQFKVFF